MWVVLAEAVPRPDVACPRGAPRVLDMAAMEDITMTDTRKITKESMKAKTIMMSTVRSALPLKLNLKQ